MSLTVVPSHPVTPHRVVGKTVRDEDYPFGSFLLPRKLRPHVAAFYRFARQADDVADAPDCAAETKLMLLAQLEASLDGAEHDDQATHAAILLRRSLLATGVDATHAKALLAAFRQDAYGWRCQTWDDLLAYCQLSAAPVGRYLLALHGEGECAEGAADALCAAVQILNHVQDCRADWMALGRVYLPDDWLRAEGVEPPDLAAAISSAALRRVINRVLDGTERLLVQAAPLSRHLRNRRLRAEAAVIQALAERLLRKLRSADPLHSRVKLGAMEATLAFLDGLWRAANAR